MLEDDRYFNKLIDDHLIVIDIKKWELLILNQTAAYIWLLLNEKSKTVDEISSYLIETFNITKEKAFEHINPLLNEWIEKELIIKTKENLYQIYTKIDYIDKNHSLSNIKTFNLHKKNTPII
ncbi:MAG: PqqD family protein [Aliarcobacter sp.]|nr:PqqD family protein [Aliarcobacter sp.]